MRPYTKGNWHYPPRGEPFGVMLRPMNMWRMTAGLLGSASLLLATGCGAGAANKRQDAASAPTSATQPCLPSRLVVSPATVAVGGSVVLSAPAFACASTYPPGKTYTVTLGLVGRGEPKSLGAVPVHTDGSFRATLAIPASAAPGEAYLIVRGSAFDNCGTDGAGSCAGYASPPLTLTHA